jgi:hypothetical protein
MDHGPFESKNGAMVLVIWDPYIESWWIKYI